LDAQPLEVSAYVYPAPRQATRY